MEIPKTIFEITSGDKSFIEQVGKVYPHDTPPVHLYRTAALMLAFSYELNGDSKMAYEILAMTKKEWDKPKGLVGFVGFLSDIHSSTNTKSFFFTSELCVFMLKTFMPDMFVNERARQVSTLVAAHYKKEPITLREFDRDILTHLIHSVYDFRKQYLLPQYSVVVDDCFYGLTMMKEGAFTVQKLDIPEKTSLRAPLPYSDTDVLNAFHALLTPEFFKRFKSFLLAEN